MVCSRQRELQFQRVAKGPPGKHPSVSVQANAREAGVTPEPKVAVTQRGLQAAGGSSGANFRRRSMTNAAMSTGTSVFDFTFNFAPLTGHPYS